MCPAGGYLGSDLGSCGLPPLMEPIGALRRDVVDANSLKNMVGPWGLEPQTSTVSIKRAPPLE